MNIEPLESRIAPATLFALNEANQLLRFDSATPGTIDATLPISGLGAGETLRGIDFRPETSELFAVSVAAGSANNSLVHTYILDTTTGVLTVVGQTVAALAGAADVPTGFDFNPAVDRMRYVNTSNENARLNPNNGSLAGNDTDLTFTAPATGPIIAAAYDRNFANTTLTTLFAIDSGADRLVVQGGINGAAPGGQNGGAITDIGALGFILSATADGGFDIENATGIAYAALTAGDNVTRLYTIDLTSGAATETGAIGTGAIGIRSLSAAPPQAIQIVNDKTATYLDQEGDRVTVKVSQGTLDAGNFKMAFKANGGLELHLLNLSGAEFNLANVSILAKKTAAGGDGFAQVGRIDATAVDLGKVTVGGDLAQIDAGDGDPGKPSLAALGVHSLGVANVSERLFGDVVSSLNGSLGSLAVKNDVLGASVNVAGNIGTVAIGGSLIGSTVPDSGAILATGNIGTVKIGGSIVGAGGMRSGAVDAGGTLTSIRIGGSIFGGAGVNSGLVESTLDMGTVFIGGNVVGGSDDHTGTVHGEAGIKSVIVLGSIIGGTVAVAGDLNSGLVYASGAGTNNLGSVKVGGSLIGANGGFSGIYADDHLASASIGGSLLGNAGVGSGAITAGSAGKVMILGNVVGGAGSQSGSVRAFGGGGLGDVTIGGSLFATTNTLTGILSEGALRVVKIGGEVRGLGSAPVRISAQGDLNPADVADALAIKSVTIARGVANALILGGYDTGGTATNPDAQIGTVTVGGDWAASSLVTGATTGSDAFFGNANDASLSDGDGDGVVARIAKIVIKGSVAGTYIPTSHFGFVAHEIGSLTIGGRKVPLTPGPGNDDLTAGNPLLILAASGDVRVHETAV